MFHSIILSFLYALIILRSRAYLTQIILIIYNLMLMNRILFSCLTLHDNNFMESIISANRFLYPCRNRFFFYHEIYTICCYFLYAWECCLKNGYAQPIMQIILKLDTIMLLLIAVLVVK
jgi:hypothetical protein